MKILTIFFSACKLLLYYSLSLSILLQKKTGGFFSCFFSKNSKKSLGLSFVFIFFLILSAESIIFAKISIVSPLSQSCILTDKVILIGRVDSVNDNYIKIFSHGLLVKSFKVNNLIFSTELKLTSGLNKFTIQDKASKVVLKLFYLSNSKKLPKKFKMFYTHKFISLKKCSMCHKTKNYKNIKQTVANCTTGICHKGISSNKFVHGPVAVKNCISCHNPHGSYSSKLLSKTGGTLCYSCHRDKKKEFKKKFIHSPVKRGKCLLCHDAHGSKIKYQIKAENLEKLCFKCHDKKKFTGKKFIHGPVAVGKCLDCHNPHASNKKNLIREDDKVKILCFKCHDKKRFVKNKFIHGPVGGGLCFKCHEPHNSNNPNLLKVPAKNGVLCFECHNRYKIVDNKFVHGPVGAGLCNSCHKTHSSKFPHLLKDSNKHGELCFKCHKDAEKSFDKIYKHQPVEKSCSNCHSPHSSPYRFQLFADYKEELCLQCHKKIEEKYFTNPEIKLHPILKEKGCIACHNPHASDYKKLLPNKINKSCFKCHRKFKKIKRGHPVARHPVKGRKNPLNKRKRFSCASCHDPHGSVNEFLLIGPLENSVFCRKCHNY